MFIAIGYFWLIRETGVVLRPLPAAPGGQLSLCPAASYAIVPVSPAKTDESIELSLQRQAHVGPRNHLLRCCHLANTTERSCVMAVRPYAKLI